MFRFAIVVLAVVGMVSLFGSGVSGAAAGLGFLFLFPLLLLAKVFLLMMLFGMIGRGFGRRDPSRSEMPWGRWRRPQTKRSDQPSREDRFEEWHRMAHAKEEVDSWLEDVD